MAEKVMVNSAFNLEDPKQLEIDLLEVAKQMIDAKDMPVTQDTGLFLKYEASSLAAALADFKRQGKGIDEAMQAYANVFSGIFSRALFSLLSDEVIADETCRIVKEIGTAIVNTVAANCKLHKRKVDKSPLMRMPDSGTVH